MEDNNDFFLSSFIIAPNNLVSDEARKYIRSRAAQAGHRSGSRRRKSHSSGAPALGEAQNHVLSTRGEKDGPNTKGPMELTILSAVRASESSNIVPCRPPVSARRKTKPVLKKKFGPEPPPSRSVTSRNQPYPSPRSSTTSSAASSEADLPRRHDFAQLLYPSPLSTPSDHGYPVPFRPWYPPLIENMWAWMLASWSHLSTTTSGEHLPALRWVQQTTMTEPCYFYINILSYVADKQQKNQFLIPHENILWLETQVVHELNVAIERATSSSSLESFTPGAILTVGRIALREIVLGDREKGEKIHRPAQAKMIAMAGGLEAVGLPSLVVEHVRWGDRLMRHITGMGMEDVLGEKTPQMESRADRCSGQHGTRRIKKAQVRPEEPSDGDFKVLEQYTGPRGLERTS